MSRIETPRSLTVLRLERGALSAPEICRRLGCNFDHLGRGTLDVDTAQTASNTEPGWEAFEELSPLEAWNADANR
jgi:hypothetical protein